MKYRIVATGEVIPFSQFPEFFHNVSLPTVLSAADMAYLGVEEVPDPLETTSAEMPLV